jgi:F-type H+-transporting ATPase subunit epsilon
MAQIELSIVTPERRVVPGPEQDRFVVDELKAPGGQGYFGVRPGHTPFLTRMEPGELWFRSGSTTGSFAVGAGFIEVERDKVSVLAEEAVPADKINVDEARKALADAQSKMKTLNTNDAAYLSEQSRARWAQAKLLVAGQKA